MLILFVLSCVIHSTTLTGVVDIVGKKSCTVELDNGTFVTFESNICKKAREGDRIRFYGRDR